jgi:hypothetical protein
MMLDPLVLKLVAICFGLLLLLAAVHKLTALDSFRVTLAAYQLLPSALIAPMSLLVPIIEVILGAAWLLDVQAVPVAQTSAALLASYTAAITINLLRGRVHIDCGCGLASSAGRDSQLSWGLVIRNTVLIVAALGAGLPSTERTLGALDYVTLVAGLLAVALMYGAANQLLNNGAAIGTWRNRHD